MNSGFEQFFLFFKFPGHGAGLRMDVHKTKLENIQKMSYQKIEASGTGNIERGGGWTGRGEID